MGFVMERTPKVSRALMLTLLLAQPIAAQAAPWRVQDELGSDHFILTGQSLARFESLDGQYRQSRGDSEQMLIIRNRILGGLKFGGWTVATEFMDVRQELADERSPISTGMINTLEFVQAYVQYTSNHFFADNDRLMVKVGKQVMDLGGRRLIASTRFRGSENAFAGARVDWNSGSGVDLKAVYFSPVLRLPDDRPSLLKNENEVDEILDQTRFYGGSLSVDVVDKVLNLEVTALKLTEDDTLELATLDRDIATVGGQLRYRPESVPLVAEVEGYYQWGESSISTASTALLDHLAWYGRVDVGWQFEGPMSPRVSVMYDYVSGDRDPNDGENNRFSSLYGIQPPDYGWTGIYGAFVRESLKSPGVRISLSPVNSVSLQFTYRDMSLAAPKDRWVKAGLRDSSGESGSDLGAQLNVKAVWKVIPGNLRIMAGYSNLFAGTFQQNITGKRFDTHYGFIEAIVDF